MGELQVTPSQAESVINSWLSYERLHLAFLVLSSNGIACLEIADEHTNKNWDDFYSAVEFYWDGRGPLKELFGGCFFQQEDVERAAQAGFLRLSFCAKEQSEIEVVAYGIIAELETRGLSPELRLAEQEILLPFEQPAVRESEIFKMNPTDG